MRHPSPTPTRCQTVTRQRGFTLIELVMVITIMGIVGSIIAAFMRQPIDAYLDSARRSGLTDVADTAVRRMGRDIRKALPNSVRIPNANCLEFIPTKTGGRYRAEDAVSGDGSALSFATADTSFSMFGSNNALPLDQRIVQNDVVAVYNLGISGVDAYAEENTSSVSGAPVDGTETTIPIDSKLFPLPSSGNRFQVVPKDEKVVSYVCTGGNLRRTASTSFYLASSSAVCPSSGPILASSITCSFDYSGSDLQRNALVRVVMQIQRKDESVNLYHEIHVNNTP
jgi:MSHA biogenesis protein MshO